MSAPVSLSPKAFCEWGLAGIEMLRDRVSVLVIVDVLSFTTAVDVAVSRGAAIIPFPLGDRAAAGLAAERAGARLALPRRVAVEQGGFSLSPGSLAAIEAGTRLLLPSPNGSRLSLAGGPVPVLAGCLRNATAVAVAARRIAGDGAVGVIPAGEHWPDGSLRPGIEDLIGAGAILHALGLSFSAEAQAPSAEAQAFSPEARVARDAFLSAAADLPGLIGGCLSGQELIGWGFAQDVDVAVALDVSVTAPLLRDGIYRHA